MIRSVIIDDEFLARERLKKLLEEHEDVLLLGEGRNGKEGLELLDARSPDLIFLDIEMPDLDGFSVLSEVSDPPMVVFTTAYSNYAVKAFEVHATDYLLKPFDDGRLAECLSRVRDKIDVHKSAELGLKMKAIIKSHVADNSQYRQSFMIKEKGRLDRVFVDDVTVMQADGNYVRLITPGKMHMCRMRMNSLERELDPTRFVRIHRTFIVNKYAVKSHKYLGNNEYQFIMKDGSMVTSSRSYKAAVQATFLSSRGFE